MPGPFTVEIGQVRPHSQVIGQVRVDFSKWESRDDSAAIKQLNRNRGIVIVITINIPLFPFNCLIHALSILEFEGCNDDLFNLHFDKAHLKKVHSSLTYLDLESTGQFIKRKDLGVTFNQTWIGSCCIVVMALYTCRGNISSTS